MKKISFVCQNAEIPAAKLRFVLNDAQHRFGLQLVFRSKFRRFAETRMCKHYLAAARA